MIQKTFNPSFTQSIPIISVIITEKYSPNTMIFVANLPKLSVYNYQIRICLYPVYATFCIGLKKRNREVINRNESNSCKICFDKMW